MKKNVALILFSKEPVAGEVKTRLIPALGSQGANMLYKRFLIHAINELKKVKDVEFMIYTTKLPHIQLAKSFFSNESLHFQEGKDLGEKMYNCFHKQLKNYNKVILLGADCPAIDSHMIIKAIRKLDNYQHVFIPVTDGGYSLIGSTNLVKEIFNNISWGTNKVIQQTLSKLDALKQSYILLPEQYDIDTINDLLRLRKNPKLSYLVDTLEFNHE